MTETLGQRLGRLRKAKRLRQDEVAAATGVHAQTVSKWERDEQTVAGRYLVPLSRILGVTVETLTGSTENVSRETFPGRIVPNGPPTAASIIAALGDVEWIRRQEGVIDADEQAEFGYQIALRRQLPPEEMAKIIRWREELLGTDEPPRMPRLL